MNNEKQDAKICEECEVQLSENSNLELKVFGKDMIFENLCSDCKKHKMMQVISALYNLGFKDSVTQRG